MAKRYLPFDPKTAFAEEAVTLTTSGVVEDGEEPVVLKVGPGRHDAWLVVAVTAMAQKPDIEGEEDEVTPGGPAGAYRFILQGSDAEDFDTGEEATRVENLAVLEVGDASVMLGADASDRGIGLYAIPVANEVAQQFGELNWLRLYVQIVPTTEGDEEEDIEEVPESITFKAWLSKEPSA